MKIRQIPGMSRLVDLKRSLPQGEYDLNEQEQLEVRNILVVQYCPCGHSEIRLYGWSIYLTCSTLRQKALAFRELFGRMPKMTIESDSYWWKERKQGNIQLIGEHRLMKIGSVS